MIGTEHRDCRDRKDEGHEAILVIRPTPCRAARIIARTASSMLITATDPPQPVFKYRFNIDGDVGFIAHNDSAALHCILPKVVSFS
jgi:hypothetical protein